MTGIDPEIIEAEIEIFDRFLGVALARTGGDVIKAARLARLAYYLESFDGKDHQ